MTEKYSFEELIVTQFPRKGRGWTGGGTVANGYFYEAGGKSAMTGKRDIQTGQIVGEVISTAIPTSIHDLSYDRFSNAMWVSPGGGLQEYWLLDMQSVPWTKIKAIPRPRYGYGIFCDRETPDVMWCADQDHNQIICMSTATGGEFVRHVPLPFPPRGVAKVGDDFWCTQNANPGDQGILFRVNASGDILNQFVFPPGKNTHGAGGITLDDDGYLWAVGGKNLPIYKLDIAKITGEITPDEPVTPPDDPEDNTIQGVLSRLAVIEAWIEEMKIKFNL